MAPPTLLAIAQRACIRNIAGLDNVGDMSYKLVEPLLRKISNPNQLRKIEIASPHIADHSADLWKAFIARDIPQWRDTSLVPRNPRSWWKVYRKLMREEHKEIEESEQQLKAAMQGIEQGKESIKIVRKVLSEPVRSRPVFADGIRNPYVNSIGVMKRSTLKNAKTGRDIMHALRKQSSSATKEKNLGLNRPSQPASAMVKPAKMQVTKAPRDMVRDHQLTTAARQMTNEQRPKHTPNVFAGRSAPSRADKEIADALRAQQAKKEDRLRTLASGKPATPLPRPSSGQGRLAAASTSTLHPSPSTSKSVPTTSPLPAPRAAGEASKPANANPPPPLIRKRPAPSIFMPSKKRKV